MFETTLSIIAGGALVGIVWIAGIAPAFFGYRAWAGVEWTSRRTFRYAWTTAYLLGALTYAALIAGGLVSY